MSAKRSKRQDALMDVCERVVVIEKDEKDRILFSISLYALYMLLNCDVWLWGNVGND